MVKYVAVKDEKVIGQFYDEEIAKRFAKEEKAKALWEYPRRLSWYTKTTR